jgi:hypothetical protein
MMMFFPAVDTNDTRITFIKQFKIKLLAISSSKYDISIKQVKNVNILLYFAYLLHRYIEVLFKVLHNF